MKEVHSWTGGIYGGRFLVDGRPSVDPVPAALDWDLWLTTAGARPYNENMFHKWRSWIDFSAGGSLGDWIVHCLGPAHLALQLHLKPPTSVECVEVTGRNQFVWPESAHLRYEFPERGGMPPVTIHAYLNLRGDVKYPDGMAVDERLFPPSNNLAERGRYVPPDPGFRGVSGSAHAAKPKGSGPASEPVDRTEATRQR